MTSRKRTEKHRVSGSRWEAQCDTQWEFYIGNTAGDKLWETLGDKVPRFPIPCAYMPEEGGMPHHPLLLEIETQQLSAVGNFMVKIHRLGG